MGVSNNSDYAKPVLRWAGSKKKILHELKPYWGAGFNRYIEPFAGSAQLFFSLKPRSAILCDINKDLINVYHCIKEDYLRIYNELQKYSVSKEDYYQIRTKYNLEKDPFKKSVQFIYLNRFCFNGLYRTNLSGNFNVPYSGVRTGSLPSSDELGRVSIALRNTKLIYGDFENILRDHVNMDDFVYLDPPFALENKRIFTQYGPTSFGLSDFDRLRNMLEIMNERGVYFLMSYASDDTIKAKFSKWDIKEISINRNIAGFANKRKIAKELLISNINFR